MLLENIPLGKTLEIYVEREEYRYRLVSKVEDTNNRRVCVSAIASNGRFFKFRDTDKIRILYRDSEVMWEWDKVKAGLAKLDDSPVHYFQILDKGKTFNRRNAYRVQLLEEIKISYYKITGKPEKFAEADGVDEEDKQLVTVEALLKDVSENGVGIYTDEKLNNADNIFFDIPSTYGKLPVKAQVVREIEVQSSRSKYSYYYGCVLTKSDKRLIRFIFDVQREKLKKQRGE